MTRKLHIKTYGCQMNVYDSARMAELLVPLGYGPTEDAADADFVILNTCHIREKAAEKVYSDLGRLNEIKRARAAEGKRLTLAVAGCVAQAEGDEIRARAPYVDLIFGPQTYHRLPELVARAARASGTVLETDFPAESKFDYLPDTRAPGTGAAAGFVAVQEGCDKFCTFCVVPYTRGAEYSRPARQVLAEVRSLASQGTREITLLGQNVNNYQGEGPDGKIWTLARLIRDVADIPGVARVRYVTSYPADMSDELIAAHRDVPALMPYLHLPVQSGSDRVLAAMNRHHGADDFRRLVDRLRDARPDLALASDFIVGFPGESDADFAATLALVRDVGFAQAYSFKYSARPGTPASALPGQVAETVKAERLAVLQDLLDYQQRAFNERCAGRTLPVLFEREGKHAGQLVGRSPYMQAVHALAPKSLLGAIAEIRIVAGHANSLAGERLAA
ncbi:MAG: tRNA (N6-isopentenyl adenosine(37)-C2)-methylthiotransferase MiaB [Alphaproteobacteria bacterium]|nr:tRNA (N6-isopentenyl adenosine(37)-C2)-methylthiotransferase MiaB [Alphaproteobacteria bacterium]MBM3951224.1 tRNA (N6-isopentenyl adenosine(37)-C2)-methylthiotransferase MiaB [Rhodospirillales bacterium]